MLQRGNNVIAVLRPGMLDVAHIVRGRVVATDRVFFDAEVWEDAWREALTPLDDPLREALRGIDVTSPGSRVRVLLESPAAMVQATSLPHGARAAQRVGLARAAESLTGESSESLRVAIPLCAASVNPETGGEATLVLSAAERERTAQAVMGWVERAGMRLVGVTPVKAVCLHHTIEAVSRSRTQSVCCVLDEGCTAIAAGSREGVHFARGVDVGFRLLAEAYRRALAETPGGLATGLPSVGIGSMGADGGRAAVERAFALMADYGVPGFGAHPTEVSAELRRHVVPLLQPVLQRYLVELKQTLRFAVPRWAGRPKSMVLTGPGAAIPALAEVLAEGLELPVEVSPEAGEADPRTPFGPTSAAAMRINGAAKAMVLRPTAAVVRRERGHLNTAMKVGAAVGVIVLGGEAFGIWHETTKTQDAIAQIRPSVQALAEFRERWREAADTVDGFALVESAREDAMGPAPVWDAVLVELAELREDQVDLTEVRLFMEDSRPVVMIEGVTHPGAADPRAELREFLERLAGSPMFRSTQLVSATREAVAGGEARRFRVRGVAEQLPAVAEPDQLNSLLAEANSSDPAGEGVDP